VRQAKTRSELPVRKSLQHLGISPSTYYRWKREEPFSGRRRSEPMKPQQVFEALPEEKQAVRKYALEHPEIRHRELSWRMLDDDIVALSSSAVYRSLREQCSPSRKLIRYK